MRSTPTILAVVSGLVLLGLGVPALAQSAAAFQPMNPSDAPFIMRAGNGVYNTDTSNSRSVIANYGVSQAGSGGAKYSFSVAVYNNGGTMSCQAFAITLTPTFAVTTGTAVSTTTAAELNLLPTVQVTSAGNYAVAVVCTLPPSNGAGNGTVFGMWP
jgi:hypothetical protein